MLFKIQIIFSKNLWKYYFSWRSLFESIFKTFGFIFIIIQMVAFFKPSIVLQLQQSWLICLSLIIPLAILYGIYKIIPKISEYHKFRNTDVDLGFQIQDFFKIPGDKVIATNTTFEMKTENEGGVIATDSLQGQMCQKYYSNIEHLDSDISKALKENVQKSKIGNVIKIKPSSEIFYLIALTNLNENGVVTESKFEDLQVCLVNLWQYIGNRGNYGHIIIPLVGSGRARINKNRIDIAKAIIRSFTAAISERKFCEKLTICIYPSDYQKHEINIEELSDFIQYSCLFTEFSDSLKKPVGTPISYSL